MWSCSEQPRRHPIERLMGRLGVPVHIARVLAVSPSERAPWFGGIAVALLVAVAADLFSASERTVFAFLVAAPLLPLMGVTAAITFRRDPLHELVVAVPTPGFKLFLMRALAVLIPTVAVAAGASVLVPAAAHSRRQRRHRPPALARRDHREGRLRRCHLQRPRPVVANRRASTHPTNSEHHRHTARQDRNRHRPRPPHPPPHPGPNHEHHPPPSPSARPPSRLATTPTAAINRIKLMEDKYPGIFDGLQDPDRQW